VRAIKNKLKVILTKEKGVILFLLFWWSFYLSFQLVSIYGGDAGDLVAAALTRGIPHPPGYPLFTALASLLVKLPFYTPAWRVALLSSFAGAATLLTIFIIIKKLTHSFLASLIAATILGFNYTFWLYNEVPEVFSLNNLLAAILIYLGIQIWEAKQIKKYLYLIVFVFAIGLTHHHTILFLLPALLYSINKNKSKIKKWLWFDSLRLVLIFVMGLLPLLYLPLASRTNSLVDWGNVVNLNNLVRLTLRADYGTFKASASLGNKPVFRLASVVSFFSFVWQDFLPIGIILLFLGFIFLRLKNKGLFWFFVIAITALVFFIFYASYILLNDFMVATFERFMLLPYLVFSIILGCGLGYVFQMLQKRIKHKGPLLLFKLVFILYPVIILATNYPKISILRNDLTAENMIEDILLSLPDNSILFLSTDTLLFDSQYYEAAYNKRSDVKLIHLYKLNKDYYQKSLKSHHPDLVIPQTSENEFMNEFLKANNKLPIFNTVDGEEFTKGGIMIPRGLVMQYYSDVTSTPSAKLVFTENNRLWELYHSPLSGSLKNFTNLYLADVLRVYATARKKNGEYFLEKGNLNDAETYFREGLELGPKDIELYLLLGRTLLAKKNCGEAEVTFKKILEVNPKDVLALAYLRKTYLECWQDNQKAKDFENSCLEQEEQGQVKLKDL
jgi:tetratricopeptide (TPR) repeat protein